MRFSLLGFILIFTFLGCQKNEKSIKFSFKYMPGEIYTYQILDDVQSKHISGQGSRKNYLQTEEQISTIKILGQDSTGIYKLYVSFVIQYDSLWQIEEGQKIRRPRRRKRRGKKYEYTLHMGQDGEILDIKGRDENSIFFYERAYKTSQPVFPRQKIAPGYSWRQSVAVNMPNAEPFTAVTTYTFTGFQPIGEYTCAVIDFHSSLEIKTDLARTKWNKKQHKKWDYENIMTSEGKIYFDYIKGAMVKKETLFTVNRKSDIIDKDGFAKKDSRITLDRERIKLISIRQDSSFSTAQ